ncbi:uncharacterized protein YydD (DUF2326 family) [Chryseobacterium sp. PvR013]|uniref:hypothetical protein n=1 Tax=Chryseobacterium sp. PvR013 TaxID=2806595 RepID=UPI001AE3E54B|nr:hypothetical protein [Chryseobacterium sp. PvR013]MBP1165056.1 uncharacterized protein YydD (DUF2326 family) [Chryseobacterium sp. PvR013]
MYSVYETKLDKAREEIADLVHKIISASRMNYSIEDYSKFKDEFIRLKKEYAEGLKEELSVESDEITKRNFTRLQEFYKKNIADIDNTHLRTLESSKIYFK